MSKEKEKEEKKKRDLESWVEKMEVCVGVKQQFPENDRAISGNSR